MFHPPRREKLWAVRNKVETSICRSEPCENITGRNKGKGIGAEFLKKKQKELKQRKGIYIAWVTEIFLKKRSVVGLREKGECAIL